MGVLGDGDTCLSTTNRNFPGRMGHPKALVYLSNPVVAAASAVAGEIIHPAEIMKREPVAV
jgi:3-isopropylmalate/(R)-2-methylmalate dehydratase large subunit